MIQLNNISLSFGSTLIFDDASLKINPGQCLGICAPNGTGKTTLLQCISNEIEVQSGTISRPEGLRLSYFHQEGVELGTASLREELEGAYGQYFALETQIREREEHIAMLSAKPDNEATMQQLSQALDQLEILHQRQAEFGYSQREAQMVYMLKSLGFRAEDLDRPGNTFSGGWQMKVGLAKVLLSKPDVMMLDEPTNHLDLEARMWLIGVLNKLSSTQILISHDRYFLDHCTNAIAELWDGKINLYSGNYSKYETQRIKRHEIAAKQRQDHEKFRKKEEVFIERFRYKSTKARQVQSRIRALEKVEQELEAKNPLSSKASQIHLQFVLSRLSGMQPLEVENISKSYDGQLALENVHFNLGRGEKIALLGPNGCGKSTLLRILAGQDKSYQGKLRWGSHVQLAYFSQRAADLLDENQSVWEHILALESPADELGRRKTLGMFLFQGDDIYCEIAKLSGGEKARLLLCSLVLQPCNFLILDEPSNHLDLDTQEILLGALQSFPGTVLFTSHDRYLLEELADKVIVLEKPEGGASSAHIYFGDYNYYSWKRAEETKLKEDLKAPEPQYQNKKDERAQKRKLEKEEAKIAKAIEALEEDIRQIQESFAREEIYKDAQKIQELKNTLRTAEQQLEVLYSNWEDISAKITQEGQS